MSTTRRTLAVPPSRHCPTAQPAGAMVAGPAAPPPSSPRPDPVTIARAVDTARHDVWLARCAAARVAAVARGPEGAADVAEIDALVSADAEAWEARTRTGREG